MGLDLLLFQADKDGNPEAIKESQRARFKSDTIVDEIQNDYKQWVKGTSPPPGRELKLMILAVSYELDTTNKEINSTVKEIGKIMKVRDVYVVVELIGRPRGMLQSYLQRKVSWRNGRQPC